MTVSSWRYVPGTGETGAGDMLWGQISGGGSHGSVPSRSERAV